MRGTAAVTLLLLPLLAVEYVVGDECSVVARQDCGTCRLGDRELL